MAAHKISVPKDTGEIEKQILDLGELPVKLNPQLCKGQAAPLFDVDGLDGKKIRLKDLRGKIVLLSFWASWCGECVADIPMLKELYREFGMNERFVMIGLSLDRSEQALRRFVKNQEMNWPQGLLGDWSQSRIPSQYAVSFIPTKFLIDQNGVLVDVLRGPKLREAIEKALADLD
ncbi:MAG: TlpA family protein disulfide reductase [Candidatus Hydrogenedentota bacterium]|nr:MAG: TlpA family protein disulfide reductase [Candidatus Hydrogenedentota bacterium]